MSAADYLSLARIPLGVAFLLVASHTLLAFVVLAAAGVTDVLDGWVARRQRPTGVDAQADGAHTGKHHRGEWLDPLCDKLFVAAVVAGLYLAQRPPVWLLLLMLTREILQTISVTIMHLVPALHARSRDYDFRAHPIGKATTVVQFATGAALLLAPPAAMPLACMTAVLGLISVGIYIDRLRRTQLMTPPLPTPPPTRKEPGAR